MVGLEKMIDHIRKEGQQEREKILVEAAIQAEKIQKTYDEKAKTVERTLRMQYEQRLMQEEKSHRDLLQMERRNLLLQTKQELVNKAFQNTLQVLEGLDEQRKEKLYLVLAEMAVIPGEKGEVLLCSGEKKAAGAALLTKYPSLQIAKDTCPKPGFRLRYGAVEIDCTFCAILEDIKESLSTQIAEILFEERSNEK